MRAHVFHGLQVNSLPIDSKQLDFRNVCILSKTAVLLTQRNGGERVVSQWDEYILMDPARQDPCLGRKKLEQSLQFAVTKPVKQMMSWHKKEILCRQHNRMEQGKNPTDKLWVQTFSRLVNRGIYYNTIGFLVELTMYLPVKQMSHYE